LLGLHKVAVFARCVVVVIIAEESCIVKLINALYASDLEA
jgi:hypothetical protein